VLAQHCTGRCSRSGAAPAVDGREERAVLIAHEVNGEFGFKPPHLRWVNPRGAIVWQPFVPRRELASSAGHRQTALRGLLAATVRQQCLQLCGLDGLQYAAHAARQQVFEV
jgi:hypothetical protein